MQVVLVLYCMLIQILRPTSKRVMKTWNYELINDIAIQILILSLLHPLEVEHLFPQFCC